MKLELIMDRALLTRKVNNIVEKKKRIAQDRVFDSGRVFEDQAVRFAPVATGALQEAIDKKQKVGRRGPEVRVGSTVEYAAFQEFGTSRNRAHPFIRPALQMAVSHLRVRVR